MKKILNMGVLILLSIIVILSCKQHVGVTTIAVTGVTLNQETAEVGMGSEILLQATVIPTNATNKAVTWASDNPDIATVDANGTVKGVKEGSTTITVTTADGSKPATCQVTVKPYISIKYADLETELAKLSATEIHYIYIPDLENAHLTRDGLLEQKLTKAAKKVALKLPKSTNLSTIGEAAFQCCRSLTSIIIPDSVTAIGNSAFSNCITLTSIIIPDSVTSIGEAAFVVCSSLTSISIPNSVTAIREWAFYDCSSLTSIKIPNSVTSIGSHAFYDCSSLTSIKIPNSVTSIGDGAFGKAPHLCVKKVLVPNQAVYNLVVGEGDYPKERVEGYGGYTVP